MRSQTELADLLAADGLHVTQATLSRDLVELDAVKVRAAARRPGLRRTRRGRRPHPGAARETAAARHRLARLCASCWSAPRRSANLVVLRTPPGAAQFLASALDKAELGDVSAPSPATTPCW